MNFFSSARLVLVLSLLGGVAAAAPQELAVPPALKASVNARKAELGKFKLGVGRFQHFFPLGPADGSVGGSGYDYAEDVLQGMLLSGLFQPAQLGIANDGDKAGWDLVAECDRLGGAKRALALDLVGKDGAAAREELPLPPAWDRPSGDRKSRVGPKRSDLMKDAGELVAYLAAAKLLGVAR